MALLTMMIGDTRIEDETTLSESTMIVPMF